MPIDYDLADEGKFRDTFYDRHHDSDHNYHRQRGSEEPNMKFAAREAEEMHIHPRRLYQPPVSTVERSHYASDDKVGSSQPRVAERTIDSIMNDNEFLSLATRILSFMENDEVMMKPNNRERSISATTALKKSLPLDTLKKFSDALNSRLNLMHQYPSWGESHVCTIVRRCEGIFGKELRALLQMHVHDDYGIRQPHEKRDDLSGPSLMHNHQSQHGTRTRVAPEDTQPIQNENRRYFAKVSPPQRFHGISKTTADDGEYDMTNHIVWEKDTHREESANYDTLGSSKGTNMTVCETMSTSSSQFNESEVYDMFVAAKPPEADKRTSHTDGTVQNVLANPEPDYDNDDKSVASMFSLSRERSLKSHKTNNRKIVSVRAPETLPGNFMFEARMNDDIFMVHVPKGGVKKGQIFQSPVLHIDSKSVFDPTGRTKRLTDMHTPSSQWRSGVCSIYSHGVFHPMAVNSLLCTYVSLAQVMARLQLDTAGNKTTSLRSRVNFTLVRIFPAVLALFHGVLFFLMYRAFHLHLNSQLWVFIYSLIPILVADLFMFGYFVYLTAKVRRLVRQEYNIEENDCLGYHDEILSFFCTPLVVAQMGRHTADYDTYVGAYCTKTGLSDHIEVKLPSDVDNYHAMEPPE